MEQKREYSSKGESLNKRVKWLLLSALTTSQPQTFFWLWLMRWLWCDVNIQFIVLVPSSSYYTIRPEISILQWNKASRYNYAIMKDSLIVISFGSELKFVCYQKCLCVCRWSSSTTAVWSPAPTWVRCSPACSSFVEMESRIFVWRMTVLQRGVGSVERAQDRDQPKLQRTSRIAK